MSTSTVGFTMKTENNIQNIATDNPVFTADSDKSKICSPEHETKKECSRSSHHRSHKKKSKTEVVDIPLDINKMIENLPEVKKYIHSLQRQLLSQQRSIRKLKKKKRMERVKSPESSTSVQGDEGASLCAADKKIQSFPHKAGDSEVGGQNWRFMEHKNGWSSQKNKEDDSGWCEGESLADQVREVAESVLQESGFVYHESLGLYYDRSTGYYYDQNTGLYYDGINKTYYSYEEETNLFHVYHQVVDLQEPEEKRETGICKKDRRKRKREAKRIEKEVCKEEAYLQEEKEDEEEGECTDSSGSECALQTAPIDNEVSDKDREPCLRLMVIETQLRDIKVGSLFLITITGGTLGREGDTHAICIQDINISKHHARFTFSNGQYFVRDMGSRNGTYLNGQRLSVALSESEDVEISHLSELRLGSTRLTCHIHPGTETCFDCEPGLVQQEDTSKGISVNKEAEYRDELLRLKRKFALSGLPPTDPTAQIEQAGYQDRASERRKTVGSITHGEKTETTSLEEHVSESNKGFKMLSKMGWQLGQALGKEGTGRTEPISLNVRKGNVGLGAVELPEFIPMDKKYKKKQETLARTRERYQQLNSSE
jgi:hypothetical protein